MSIDVEAKHDIEAAIVATHFRLAEAEKVAHAFRDDQKTHALLMDAISALKDMLVALQKLAPQFPGEVTGPISASTTKPQ